MDYVELWNCAEEMLILNCNCEEREKAKECVFTEIKLGGKEIHSYRWGFFMETIRECQFVKMTRWRKLGLYLSFKNVD